MSAKKNTWTFDPTTPKNKAKLAAWNERVIRDIALRTKPITPDERSQIITAIHGMYEAAKLPHDDLRIVFAASPFMAHVVAASAYAWWTTAAATYAATRVATRVATAAATYAATDDATDDATDVATRVATYAATDDATDDATDVATRVATADATADATNAATNAATRDATADATRDATADATRAATNAATYDAGLFGSFAAMQSSAMSVTGCSRDPLNLRDAGAEWYHWYSYLAFVRDVIGWKHDSHAHFSHSETVQRLGGVRYMHAKFVIVADHPRVRNVIWVNGVATLHCETGPAVEWSDGTAIYAIEGVALPHDGIGRKIVESPASLTVAEIDRIDNADARSIAIRRFGWHRYVREIHADCIDYRRNDIEGTREALFRTPKDGNILVAVCPTGRVFGMRVPSSTKDCAGAQSYLAGTRSGRVVART